MLLLVGQLLKWKSVTISLVCSWVDEKRLPCPPFLNMVTDWTECFWLTLVWYLSLRWNTGGVQARVKGGWDWPAHPGSPFLEGKTARTLKEIEPQNLPTKFSFKEPPCYPWDPKTHSKALPQTAPEGQHPCQC